MNPIVFPILIRLGTALACWGLVFSLGQRISDYRHLERIPRRGFLALQEVLGMIAALAVGLEIRDYVVASQGRALWMGGAWGLSPWAWGYWLALAVDLAISGVFFARGPAARYAVLKRRAEEIRADPDTPFDGREGISACRELDRLAAVFPPVLNFRCHALRREWASLSASTDEKSLAARANYFLQRRKPAEALINLKQWNPQAPETLLLAAECDNWREIAGILANASSPRSSLQHEIAQFMGTMANLEDFQIMAQRLLEEDNLRRRCAALKYRTGKEQEAAAMLASDWEARLWIPNISASERITP